MQHYWGADLFWVPFSGSPSGTVDGPTRSQFKVAIQSKPMMTTDMWSSNGLAWCLFISWSVKMTLNDEVVMVWFVMATQWQMAGGRWRGGDSAMFSFSTGPWWWQHLVLKQQTWSGVMTLKDDGKDDNEWWDGMAWQVGWHSGKWWWQWLSSSVMWWTGGEVSSSLTSW